jgi:hypothetical protein
MLNKLRKVFQLHFYEPKLAFLHVPKTGGTYLTQRGTGHQPVLPVRYLGHYYVVDRMDIPNPIYYPHSPQYYYRTILLEEIQKYEIISTVRNIFSWLVSYAWHAGGWNPKYNDADHYDYAIANKGFEYLVKTIANREDNWPNRKFIHCQFFCSNGELIVDWISHNESLDKDLEILADVYNLPFAPREKQRVGHDTDYRTYYTDELIDLVNKTWGRELDLFGYEFDGPKQGPNLLHQAITSTTKQRIQYIFDKDELVVDGRKTER